MAHPLRFNVMLMASPGRGSGSPFARFLRATELAERLGFDGVWTGNSYALGGADPFIMLGQVAARSDRLRIGTSVFLLPMRHPTAVALEVATLDQVSGGRLLLGVGVGGERGPDFSLNGVSPRERGGRMDEALTVLPRLWSGEEVHHQGRYYQIEGRLGLRPAQDPMPVLIGARGGHTPQQRRAYERAVRAQGWLPYIMTASAYARGLEAIRTLGGGDDLLLGLVEMTNIGPGDGMAALQEAAERENRVYQGGSVERFKALVLAGNVQMVIDRLTQFADLGVREFVFNWACDPDAIKDQMRILAADVLPAVREHVARLA